VENYEETQTDVRSEQLLVKSQNLESTFSVSVA
jgi:hypothetical protein